MSEKIAGALIGTAIGDGMGAPVEGWESKSIRQKFGDWDFIRFIAPQAWKPKGDGRITDDTLMVEALIRAYETKCGHVDAYDFRDFLLPEVLNTVVWLPERQQEMPIMERMNAVEKYSWFRLAIFGAEPRTAGLGNAINCALAMFIWPVGAVNAGDPRAAYQEAVAFGAAETQSYALEAAAVLAAMHAHAFLPDATIETVLSCGRQLARDGTAAALDAVLRAVDHSDDIDKFIAKARTAFMQFDHKDRHMPLESGGRMADNNQPSSRLTIEEVPIAMAALKWGKGDFVRTLNAAVSYGRDCDSIAAMACGLLGAIYGENVIPASLKEASNAANRRDWNSTAAKFTETILEITKNDRLSFQRRLTATELDSRI